MLEQELKERGVQYRKAKVPFIPYVQVDDRLVTGQNPQSPKRVAETVGQLLERK